MSSSFLDVCRFVPTAGGTTDWTYSSVVQGYQSPTAAGAVNGAMYRYRAESADLSQWEVGTATYNSSTGVFARTAVLFNSSGGTSKINFTLTPQVAIVALAEDITKFKFSAHRNGTSQTGIVSNTDTAVVFGSTFFNYGSYYNTSTGVLTPPAGQIMLSAQVLLSGTVVVGTAYICAIWKNGAVLKEGFIYSAQANTGVANVTVIDDANGTDTYQIYTRVVTSSGTATVDGTVKWSYFSGAGIM